MSWGKPADAVVRGTGDATAYRGGFANTGMFEGSVHFAAQAPAKSFYRELVRQKIAPDLLLDRDDELAELARFVTMTDPAPSYVWWRGPAWAGKSALMAWFVLHPPPGVRVLSFFITARHYGHGNRVAFVEVVLEQLAVAVAGRPNPPIPADVPDRHPLRDPAVVRHLDISRHAKVVRQDAERELDRLLEGTPAEQDLLGLITAAGGGLSGADLAEITGWLPRQVAKQLRAVSARTFRSRTGRWRPDTHAYMLAHEELQQQASRSLGEVRLEAYRQRLHTWAERYRERSWPPGTPEYLLRGYFQMLRATGDLSRMMACATDPYRHDRMLDIIGGDAAALAEISTALDTVVAQDEPDLALAGRLAVHRERLNDRNAHVPAGLPAVWARLGNLPRAEAIARSITDPRLQAQALARFAAALAGIDSDRARSLASEAEAIVRNITDSGQRVQTLARLAAALAGTDPDRAHNLASEVETTVHAITDQDRRAQALAQLAAALTVTDPHRAVITAHTITEPYWQALALAELAGVLAATDPDRAEVIARTILDPERRAWILARLAAAVAVADSDRAHNLASEAEAVARTIIDPDQRAWILAEVATALAATDPDRAEAIARTITDPERQAAALAGTAMKVQLTRARFLVADAFRVCQPRVWLPVLARIQPTAIDVVADEYIRTMHTYTGPGQPDRG